jgi:hypothetical protein
MTHYTARSVCTQWRKSAQLLNIGKVWLAHIHDGGEDAQRCLQSVNTSLHSLHPRKCLDLRIRPRKGRLGHARSPAMSATCLLLSVCRDEMLLDSGAGKHPMSLRDLYRSP